MWQLMSAELAYQRRRTWMLYAGAALVATLSNVFVPMESPKSYFMFASLFLFSGLLLHVMTLWDADTENRLSLLASLPLSRVAMGAIRMVPPLAQQTLGFALALTVWAGVILTGAAPDRAEVIEIWWALCSLNGAGLVFLLGWAHLAPEADRLWARSPWTAFLLSAVSVLIALGASALALSPWLAPELGSPVRIPYSVAALWFHVVAAALAALNLWLFTARTELTTAN